MIKLNRRTARWTSLVALALLAGGCGGGGGSAGTAEAGLDGTGGNPAVAGGGAAAVPLTISNAAPVNYQWGDLAVGEAVYVDRNYTFKVVPAEMQGSRYLQTANDDKALSDPAAITFEVNQPVTVLVSFDNRAATVPSWLQSWQDTGMRLVTTDVDLGVFQKDFPAGTVTLGGNEFGRSMYSVAVQSQGGSAGGVLSISGNPAGQIAAGLAYSFIPSATGGTGVRTFAVSNAPAWASFNTSTGALTGTPGVGDIGSIAAGVTISVSDGQTTLSLAAFSINVVSIGTGTATLSWTAPTLNADNSPLMDLAGYKIYYGTSPGNYPNSMRISNGGITTAMVENLAAGDWSFVVVAFDNSGNESSYSNVATKLVTNL